MKVRKLQSAQLFREYHVKGLTIEEDKEVDPNSMNSKKQSENSKKSEKSKKSETEKKPLLKDLMHLRTFFIRFPPQKFRSFHK